MNSVTVNSDRILKELVSKKKQLLKRLLRYSIDSALNNQSEEKVQLRTALLKDLMKNDKAIQLREQQIGQNATDVEPQAHADIFSLLQSIQSNNSDCIAKLEKEEKSNEMERSQLRKGNKISRYVTNSSPQGRYKQKALPTERKQKEFKGTV